ncbi:DUF2982 domain-containing protein [Vibrio lamellibrachiae]
MKMQSLQLSNFDMGAILTQFKPALVMAALTFIAAIYNFLDAVPATITLLLTLVVIAIIYVVIERSKVSYTLTPSHFQQHLYRGGWVVKWTDIERIGICHIEQEGEELPLPWIGIKLRRYSPYLNSICPRVGTDILLSQRALLYIGQRNNGNNKADFEDIVLDSKEYRSHSGVCYQGLRAALANRMAYQREFFGFDIFISTSDLDRDEESFVGLTRRYLAAAEHEQ